MSDAPAKKTAAKKGATSAPPTPAETAAAEALGEGDVAVEFRGQTFVIKQEIRQSFRYAMAIASNNSHQIIYEMIDVNDRGRFISLAEPGESFAAVSAEFFDAFSAAGGQGNS